MGISEGAVSKKITKLRKILKDDIFIRRAHQMELTPLIEKIAPLLEHHYNEISLVMDTSKEQDLALYHNPIAVTLVTSFYNYMAAPLTQKLHTLFPKAPLYIKRWSSNTLNDIKKGKVNIGVHLSDIEHPKEISQQTLTETQIYLASHKDIHIHSLEEIHKYPIIVTDFPQWNEYNRFYLFKQLGITPSNLIHVDSLNVTQTLTEDMPCISFLPKEMCNTSKLRITPLDKFIDKPIKYKLALFYNQNHRNDKLTQKLCSVITETVQKIHNKS